MPFDKIEIIEGTLAQQAGKFEKLAQVMRKEMNEHQGAMDALNQLAKQMPGFMTSIEERIEADEDIGNASLKVLEYSKNIIARFMAICEANAQHQQRQRFMSEGRMQMADETVANLKKEIEKQKAFAAKREEESEAQRAAYRGQPGEEGDGSSTNGKKKKTSKSRARKSRTARTGRKKTSN